jgi:hypothetical protein
VPYAMMSVKHYVFEAPLGERPPHGVVIESLSRWVVESLRLRVFGS